MLTTRQFVLGLMVACLVGAAVGTVSLGLPLLATQVFGFVVLVILLVSLVRLVRLLLVSPKARQLYPGVPLVTGLLLFGLMTLLTTFGYFRMWMVAAIVMWMHLSCGIGLLTTQGRERHQLAVNMAIGVPVILVLVVLVFLVSDGPLF
jgi:hypothetical protein